MSNPQSPADAASTTGFAAVLRKEDHVVASRIPRPQSAIVQRLRFLGLATAVAVVGLLSPNAAAAQSTPTAGMVPSIAVIGFGEAEATADTATLQFFLSLSDPFTGPPARPRPGVEPGSEEREAVAPIVDLIESNGVSREDVQITTSLALTGPYGPSSSSAVLVEFPVAEPTREDLNQLVDAVGQAAGDQGLFLTQVGATYEVADCAPVRRAAREAAVEDARAQAGVQAEILGVELGEVIVSSDVPVSALSPYPGNTCEPVGSSPIAAGIAIEPFDPTAEPVVEIYRQVMVTFATAEEG
jgi:uncharacterized protein YggE